MTSISVAVERSIARCRLILSVSALVAVYVDPTEPAGGGLFTITPWVLGALLAHLLFAAATNLVLRRPPGTLDGFARLTSALDVAFAMVIALVTEGTSSPFHVFFSFALIAVGFRWGLGRTLQVTAAAIVLYVSLTALGEHPEDLNLRIMRTVYLGILGYLLGYLGERRLELEGTVRDLEAAAQRASIARSLHDGFCQALAAVNIRLEACRELLRQGRNHDALEQLGALQSGVTREYDHLRTFVRTLADRDPSAAADAAAQRSTAFTVRMDLEGDANLVEHVLQIVREAVANVRCHAHAGSAVITVRPRGTALAITVDDDGVGFPPESDPPWSISSRARELGGGVRVAHDGRPGAHLEVVVPRLGTAA
jgi:signal transduction histidine kinase